MSSSEFSKPRVIPVVFADCEAAKSFFGNLQQTPVRIILRRQTARNSVTAFVESLFFWPQR
jgi:hypothetical protein